MSSGPTFRLRSGRWRSQSRTARGPGCWACPIADRVAQTATAMFLGPLVEPRFHPDSYGYRPKKSAHDAVGVPAAVLEAQLGDRSRRPEVLRHRSLGPGGSCGRGGHRLPLGAVVRQAVAESAAAAPGRHACAARQGNPARVGDLAGPGEPVFALRVRYVDGPGVPGLPVERFADDIVVHCKSGRQAEYVRAAIATRTGEVGLRIHPDKTRIVYCKDGRRRGDHEHTSFTFLGFTFRARGARGKNGRNFTGFLPAMSTEALKAKSDRLRRMRIHRRTDLTLEDLADGQTPSPPGGSTTTAGSTGPCLIPSCSASTPT